MLSMVGLSFQFHFISHLLILFNFLSKSAKVGSCREKFSAVNDYNFGLRVIAGHLNHVTKFTKYIKRKGISLALIMEFNFKQTFLSRSPSYTLLALKSFWKFFVHFN